MKAGIPLIEEYQNIKKSESFKYMEKFSDEFIILQKNALTRYPWSKDPFHAWSRQWEYPYVFDRIEDFSKKHKETLRIMDAGSGVTFFPYFLNRKFNSEIYCSDYNLTYNSIFDEINGNTDEKTIFIHGDISDLPIENNFFDIVYCISVLEHTRNYKDIIREFRRILKPNGLFIITFDIALNGDSDIAPDEAEILFDLLNGEFVPVDFKLLNHQKFKENLIENQDILTTNYIKMIDSSSLPWESNSSDFRNLTVACFTFLKNK